MACTSGGGSSAALLHPLVWLAEQLTAGGRGSGTRRRVAIDVDCCGSCLACCSGRTPQKM